MRDVQVNGNYCNNDSNDNKEANYVDERHLPLLCLCR